MNNIRYNYKIKDKGEIPSFIERDSWVKLNELFISELESSEKLEQEEGRMITYVNDKSVTIAKLDKQNKRVSISYYLLLSLAIIFIDEFDLIENQTDIFNKLAQLQFGESYHFAEIFHY